MRRPALALPLLAGGCFWWAPIYDQTIAGPYHLIAIDTPETAILCRQVSPTSCSGDRLPDQMVFAAGARDRYIVLARHPGSFDKPPDRSRTEYYYLIRAADESVTVHGPFDKKGFGIEKLRLGLPDFTSRIEEFQE